MTYFVILIDGKPLLKDGATIRNYKTRERAEKEARKWSRWIGGRKAQIAELDYVNITDVPEVSE